MGLNVESPKLVIIDTGCANTSSVKFAIERLGYIVTISRRHEVILSADKVFLPGVGSASEAMANLQQRQLIELIKQVQAPLLGICLGMQLLAKTSQENGVNAEQTVECLGLCQHDVIQLDSGDQPLPHMGWNQISYNKEHPLFKDISNGEYFYFVHSFAMPLGESTIAHCHYGNAFSAAIQSGNYYGVQFHPERSSKAGSQLIKNFIEL